MVLIGGIYHGYDAYIRPWRNRKTLKKLIDLDLRDLNLMPDEEVGCLSGSYQSFYLTIFPYANVNKGEGVRISIFIEPEEEKVPTYEKLEANYEFNVDEDEGLCWFTTYVSSNYLNGKLDAEKIRSAVNLLIDELKAANIKPQAFEDQETH